MKNDTATEAYRYWLAQPLITRPFNTSADAVAAAEEEIGTNWRATHNVRETPSGWFVSAWTY